MSKLENLQGMKFGKLTVLKRGENHIQPSGQTKVTWVVQCDCGNTQSFLVQAGHLKSGHTTSCGCAIVDVARKNQSPNLIGKIFGNLIVISRNDDEINSQGVLWWCRCLCGRSDDFIVSTKTLNSGNTTGCRKCGYEKTGKSRFIDICGQTFGMLSVIERESDYVSPQGIHKSSWKCKCSCGNTIVATSNSLKSGKVKSCGCLNESWVAKELKSYFEKNYNSTPEYKILKNPKTSQWLSYDIYIPYGNNPEINGIYIEIHGGQHYIFVPFWHKTEEKFKYNKNLDNLKKKFAKKNGTYIEIDLRKIKTTEDAIKYIENILEQTLSKLG